MWTGETITPDSFRDWLGNHLSKDIDNLISWDLMLHDTQTSSLIGANREWLASSRIDNLVSCYAAVSALSELLNTSSITVPAICLFDHEEVGSLSTSGASGNLLTGTLQRIMNPLTVEQRSQILSKSFCLSADGAHATHPNYLERHDLDHSVRLNGGVVIKRNANQRYATDAIGETFAKQICEKINIPYQIFSNRNDLLCGSTIGPTTAAHLGVRTIDIGVPQLSMHSIREICGVDDQRYLKSFFNEFFMADLPSLSDK